MEMLQEDRRAIEKLQKYIRIPSAHPDVDYEECTDFLKNYAEEIDLPIQIFTPCPKKPIVVITWKGQDTKLPSIILNSHMDVAPVDKENWIYDPFEAKVDPKGTIFGRGVQDAKSLGIQYLEAIRRLIKDGELPLRTVHVTFMPDQDIGGEEGMKAFVQTQDYTKLGVGFALDQGHASSEDEIYFFNAERPNWQFEIHCKGTPAHASSMPLDVAGLKATYCLEKINEFRDAELDRLRENPDFSLGDMTTLSVTMLKGGLQQNVLPCEFTILVDCRIGAAVSQEEMETYLDCVCEEAGQDVFITYLRKDEQGPVSSTDDGSAFYTTFMTSLTDQNIKATCRLHPGATDARYLREQGCQVFGFSPMPNTKISDHCANESLNTKVFLNGIKIFQKLIRDLANMPAL